MTTNGAEAGGGGPALARELLLELSARPTLTFQGAMRRFAPLRGRLRASDLVAGAEAVVRDDRQPAERLEPLLCGALLAVADAAPEVEVGRGEDARALAEALVRRDLPLPLRRALAAVGGELGLDVEELVDGDDPTEAPLVLAPLAVRLAQLERGDPEPWISFYCALPPETRPYMLRSLMAGHHGGALPGTPARALAPLYGVEHDPTLREGLVEALLEAPSPEAAGVLRDWRELADGRAERGALRTALRGLEQRGIAAPRSTSRTEAWMTACDGAGTYVLGLCFRPTLGAPTTIAFHLDLQTGVLGASRLSDPPEELERSFTADGERPLGRIPPARAVLRARAALARTRELGRPEPPGLAEAEPWLERVPLLGPAEGPAAADASIPREQARVRARELFEEPAFDGWLHAPELSGMGPDLPDLEREIEREDVRAVVAALLDHQAEVYACAGAALEASACALTAQQVRARGIAASPLGPSFLRRSRERLEALTTDLPGLPEGVFRDELRDRLESRREGFSRTRPPRAADLLQLDLADAVRERVELVLDEMPSAERPAAAQLTDIVLEVAGVAVERLRPRQRLRRQKLYTQQDLDALGRAAEGAFAATALPEPRRQRLVGEALWALVSFGETFCEGLCGVGCPNALEEPLPELFFAEDHPARDFLSPLPPFAPDALSAGPGGGLGGPGDLADAGGQGGPHGQGALSDLDDLEDLDDLDDLEIDEGGAEDLMLQMADEVLAALDALDLPGLDAVEDRLADFIDALEGTSLESYPVDPGDELERHAYAAFLAAAGQAPEPPPSTDPATPRARRAFDREAPALPAKLAARLMARAPAPGIVLRLALAAQESPETLEQGERFLAAFQDLWNATPRPELDGRTPNQAVQADDPPEPRRSKRPRRSRRRGRNGG